jgi:hypothetical protein
VVREEVVLASDYINWAGAKWCLLPTFQYHLRSVLEGIPYVLFKFRFLLSGYHHKLGGSGML